MTRSEHYRRAEELLAPLDKRMGKGTGGFTIFTEADRERLALAQVHATLAAAPYDVATGGQQ